METWHDRHHETLTIGERIADSVAAFVGSWTFLILHAAWFAGWIALTVEPFPYGLLTMIVSLEAIFLSTFIMISANRQSDRDRHHAEADYRTNLEAKNEIEQVQRSLSRMENVKLDALLAFHGIRVPRDFSDSEEVVVEYALRMPPHPTPENPDALLPDWSIPVAAHHNVRAICDLEGLTYQQKEVLTACVMVESGFDINAINYNYAHHADGTKYLASTDFGICQWNDFYHGKEITPDQALHNPEMAVRLMCKYWLHGLQIQWVSYSSGAYKKYLGKV